MPVQASSPSVALHTHGEARCGKKQSKSLLVEQEPHQVQDLQCKPRIGLYGSPPFAKEDDPQLEVSLVTATSQGYSTQNLSCAGF